MNISAKIRILSLGIFLSWTIIFPTLINPNLLQQITKKTCGEISPQVFIINHQKSIINNV